MLSSMQFIFPIWDKKKEKNGAQNPRRTKNKQTNKKNKCPFQPGAPWLSCFSLHHRSGLAVSPCFSPPSSPPGLGPSPQPLHPVNPDEHQAGRSATKAERVQLPKTPSALSWIPAAAAAPRLCPRTVARSSRALPYHAYAGGVGREPGELQSAEIRRLSHRERASFLRSHTSLLPPISAARGPGIPP